MEDYLIYIGKSALAAGAFYLVYLLLFQNRKQFIFNRFYLPVSLGLSFIIPLITFTSYNYIEAVPVSDNNSFAYLPEAQKINQAQIVYEWFHYLFVAYFIVAIGFLFHLLLGHFKAIRIVRESRKQTLFKTEVNVTKNDVHPFSFFNKIVVSEKTLEHPDLKMIVKHENIHVKEKHTLDILFAEILFLAQWFNPFAWLIKDAIKNNLEYKTDHQIAKTFHPKAYQMAMVTLADKEGIAPFLTALNGSQLKNRIIMMKKKTENKYAFLKQFAVLPLLAILIMGLSNNEVKTEIIQKELSENIEASNYSKGSLFDGSFRMKDSKGEWGIPLYIVDGKEVETFKDFSTEEFVSISVLKVKDAVEYYGSEGKYGVVQIATKDWKFPSDSNPLIIVDGEEFTGKIEDIPEENIFQVFEFRYPNFTGKYDKKGKDGVIEIQTNEMKPVPTFVPNALRETNGSYTFFDKTDLNSLENVHTQKHNLENKIIKGKVTDKNGDPISGASILVKGKTIGTITDAEGNYELKLHEKNETLSFVMYGFEKLEIDVDGKSEVNAKLRASQKDKSKEIKVVGYGEPGSAPNTSGSVFSINGSGENQPLYVVDGKITEKIDEISPDDIESISVLKDVSATSLYGEKGKNGVILITTKKAVQNNLAKALVIVDGKKYDGNVNDFSSDHIKKVDVLKNESATKLYGEEAKNGAIVITTKDQLNFGDKVPLIYIDGVISDKDVNDLDPGVIESITVLKDKSAIEKYGGDAKNGVIEITTKVEKITTQLELRKFIAKKIIYPKEARESNIETLLAINIRIDENGEVHETSSASEPELKLDEVVVTGLKSEKQASREVESKIFAEEGKRIVKLIPRVEIPEFKGKTVGITIKFVLQEKN